MDFSFSNALLMLGFVFIHFLSKHLTFKQFSLRVFLSFSGGVGIAYVFLHLFPTLSEAHTPLAEAMEQLPVSFPTNYTVFMIALLGFCIFYTMDRLIMIAWGSNTLTSPDRIESTIFWFHIAFFSLYTAMIGYLLVWEPYDDPIYEPLFFIAFGLHFITNDWSLRHHHENIYDHIGRWVLVSSIFIGWSIGSLVEFSEITVAIVESFVTGAMIVNVVKDELPPEREGSLRGFLSGILLSSLLFWFL